jgi:Domain of unknown function (DUF4351)
VVGGRSALGDWGRSGRLGRTVEWGLGEWMWGDRRVKALPIEQLGLLGEALLDFSGQEDLVGWLERNEVSR